MDDIPEGESRGFGDGGTESIFAVRRDSRVYLYRNRCPHASSPLNWMPHRFLDRDRRHIICSTHGALFTIETGSCVAGPCSNQSLEPIPFELRDGEVWLV